MVLCQTRPFTMGTERVFYMVGRKVSSYVVDDGTIYSTPCEGPCNIIISIVKVLIYLPHVKGLSRNLHSCEGARRTSPPCESSLSLPLWKCPRLFTPLWRYHSISTPFEGTINITSLWMGASRNLPSCEGLHPIPPVKDHYQTPLSRGVRGVRLPL